MKAYLIICIALLSAAVFAGTITKPSKRTYFIAYNDSGNVVQGVVDTNQVLSTGLPHLIYSTNLYELAEGVDSNLFTNLHEYTEESPCGIYVLSNQIYVVEECAEVFTEIE